MLSKIFNPVVFQGNLKDRHYFEGWYYKQVSGDERCAVSFIPGISLFPDDLHSFVQYIYVNIDKNTNKTIRTGYIRYPLEAFKFNHSPFMISIGENIFSETAATVKLSDQEVNIQGILWLDTFTPIKNSLLTPNIMGFFGYIPWMECYHGVISMNHILQGSLTINSNEIDFNNGKGYIEKDWGTSFPEKYIWIQCNNFNNKTVSIFSSAADIPFMGKKFKGYICNLSIDRKEYRFATYNSSKLRIERLDSKTAVLVFENRHAILTIEAMLKQPGELVAPKMGNMEKRIAEDLSGKVTIKLYDKQKKTAYEDIGCMAGIEIAGYKC
ncbi:MAG: tocopherol cyclase family protein [Clostridiaceae bacterium]